MRLKLTTGMTFEVNVEKSVHLYRHNMTSYTIAIDGVGSQRIEHNFLCPWKPEEATTKWLNWHINKSQEIQFEFIPK